MYCPNCGTLNDDDALFCSSCGTSLKETAGKNQQIEPGPDFLPEPEYEPQPEKGITHPLWQTIKGYLLYVIIAGFLFTLFSLVTVRFAIREDGEMSSGYAKLNGLTMFSGALPKIYNDQERRVMNSEITLGLSREEKQLVRTPLAFRVSYIILTLGIIFYLFTVFVYVQPHQRYLNSIARMICLLSAFSILWVYNDFENWEQRILSYNYYSTRDELMLNIESNYSLGFWAIFLSYLILGIDYVAGVITMAFKQVVEQSKNIKIKKIQTT